MSNIDKNKWIKLWKALVCGSFVISLFQDQLSIVAGEGNIGECWLIEMFMWRMKGWKRRNLHMCPTGACEIRVTASTGGKAFVESAETINVSHFFHSAKWVWWMNVNQLVGRHALQSWAKNSTHTRVFGFRKHETAPVICLTTFIVIIMKSHNLWSARPLTIESDMVKVTLPLTLISRWWLPSTWSHLQNWLHNRLR